MRPALASAGLQKITAPNIDDRVQSALVLGLCDCVRASGLFRVASKAEVVYERRSQNRPQSGDAKPFTGGAKLDRPGGPRSIPEVFCGTPEGCIKWSYTLKYGAV